MYSWDGLMEYWDALRSEGFLCLFVRSLGKIQ